MYNKTNELFLPEVKPTKPTKKKKQPKPKPKYQWERRLAEAKERGEFTAADSNLSASWATCAVGELFGMGGDHGRKVYQLGADFDTAVNRDNVSWAQRIWNELKKIKEKG